MWWPQLPKSGLWWGCWWGWALRPGSESGCSRVGTHHAQALGSSPRSHRLDAARGLISNRTKVRLKLSCSSSTFVVGWQTFWSVWRSTCAPTHPSSWRLSSGGIHSLTRGESCFGVSYVAYPQLVLSVLCCTSQHVWMPSVL